MKKLLFILLAVNLILTGCTLSEQAKTIKSIQKITNTTLDLSNQGLEKIPEYVFNATKLENLNISNNEITGAVQAEIRHLQKLRTLNLSNNFMTGIPAEIGQLKNLEILDLSNNRITGLPYELRNLTNLKTLNISNNNYSEFDLNIIQKNLSNSVNIVK
jgi:Leucine-rich repeat (LRR) protein